jgi:hypothetical protein
MQENDSSFLTTPMKMLLEGESKFPGEQRGQGSGNGGFLEYYVDQVVSASAEWCRQDGRFQAEASKSRLEHLLKNTYSKLDDVVNIVLST